MDLNAKGTINPEDVPKAKPLTAAQNNPAESKPLTAQIKAPVIQPCPMLDAAGGRCTQMGIGAHAVPGQHGKFCARQVNGWSGKPGLSCGVPKILEAAYPGNKHLQQRDLVKACDAVLNTVAELDLCPQVKVGSNGPMCRQTDQACVKVDNYRTCEVFTSVQNATGEQKGGRAGIELVRNAYVSEINRIKNGG